MVTIDVSGDVWIELNQRKRPGDSFDDVQRRLLDMPPKGEGGGETDHEHGRDVEVEAVARDIDTGDDPRDPLDNVQFPNGVDSDVAREAIDAAREYIQTEGEATRSELVREVMPTYPIRYDADAALDKLDSGKRYRGSWYRRIVQPGLEAAPDVKKPADGEQEWRYSGE